MHSLEECKQPCVQHSTSGRESLMERVLTAGRFTCSFLNSLRSDSGLQIVDFILRMLILIYKLS